RAYYRDARVLASLGMEERAPFPEGYEVETSDWDLLKPVAARGQIFRVDQGVFSCQRPRC
ncbi:MAG: hypothetical protein ACXIVD_10155, partial [Salinarimonas sp.]